MSQAESHVEVLLDMLEDQGLLVRRPTVAGNATIWPSVCRITLENPGAVRELGISALRARGRAERAVLIGGGKYYLFSTDWYGNEGATQSGYSKDCALSFRLGSYEEAMKWAGDDPARKQAIRDARAIEVVSPTSGWRVIAAPASSNKMWQAFIAASSCAGSKHAASLMGTEFPGWNDVLYLLRWRDWADSVHERSVSVHAAGMGWVAPETITGAKPYIQAVRYSRGTATVTLAKAQYGVDDTAQTEMLIQGHMLSASARARSIADLPYEDQRHLAANIAARAVRDDETRVRIEVQQLVNAVGEVLWPPMRCLLDQATSPASERDVVADTGRAGPSSQPVWNNVYQDAPPTSALFRLMTRAFQSHQPVYPAPDDTYHIGVDLAAPDDGRFVELQLQPPAGPDSQAIESNEKEEEG